MEKDKIIILKDRGLISINGEESISFLQNIITNDIEKVSRQKSIFSAIFTPQGKYLFEFFIIKDENGYLLDCDIHLKNELIKHFNKYKLQSKIKISDSTDNYFVGVISLEKFLKLQSESERQNNTIFFKESLIFVDARSKLLGARVISKKDNEKKIIEELNLKECDEKKYVDLAHKNGIPIKDLSNLQDQLFGLEANLEELQALDFKKGCYIGQENTARMKLKNKIRRKLVAVNSEKKLKLFSEIFIDKKSVGKILINGDYPFALIKIYEEDLKSNKNNLICEQSKISIFLEKN